MALSIGQFCDAWRILRQGCPDRSKAAGDGIERMGYATIAAHTLYMEKRFLESH